MPRRWARPRLFTPLLALLLAVAPWPSFASEGPPAPFTAPALTPVASFGGVGDNADPSDGGIAAGPNHLLEAINTKMAVFSKTGQKLRDQGLVQFFGLQPNAFLSDPRVLYDGASDRWFLMIIGNPSGKPQPNTAYFAYSRTPDPTGPYCQFALNISNNGQFEVDFPGTGVDDNGIYVTFTRFVIASGSLGDVLVQQLPRTPLLTCAAPFPVRQFTVKERFPDGQGVAVLQPSITFGGTGTEYFVATEANGGAYAGIWQMTGTGTPNPTLSQMRAVTIAPYVPPFPATQKGTALPVNIGDSRIASSSVFRSGALWFAFTEGFTKDLGPAVRWLQVSVTSFAIVQQGSTPVNGRNGYAYGAPMVDAAGDLAIAMTALGDQFFLSAAVGVRKATDPLNQLTDITVWANGTSAYVRAAQDSIRWGDYQGIALDPDGLKFWLEVSVATGLTSWSTQLGSLQLAAVAPVVCSGAPTPTGTVYLPNVTRMLGGPGGWTTPFIVQNVGGAPTNLEISYYRFSDGSLVLCRAVRNVQPRASSADVPDNDTDLPADTQFSVVVRSYGSPIVSVVNEVRGSGAAMQAASYTGSSVGATTVYVANVTRRFFGYDVPLIIQDLGTANASVSAAFVSFDGTQRLTVLRTVAPGRATVIDPDFTPGLVDGTQYSVVLTSDQPIAVVANAHNEAGAPVAYSHNGLVAGANAIYAPYVAKGAPGGLFSPIVVQNLGTATVNAQLDFTPLGVGGPVQSITLTGIVAGASRAFDPRFAFGTTVPCANPGTTCLGNGEYSLKISASGPIAAVILPVSDVTAAAYVAQSVTAARVFLPNITRTLGGPAGWTTPFFVQSIGAASATARWYRFSDGSLVLTQPLALSAGGSVRVDPRLVTGLQEDTQYSVVVETATGTLVAMVYELATGGDSAMAYEGFPQAP